MTAKNREILTVLFELKTKATSYEFLAGEDIELRFDSLNGILDIIDKYGIKKDVVGTNSIRVKLHQFEFPVFYDNDDFLKNITTSDKLEDIGILNHDENGYLFYDNKERIYYNNAGQTINFFISNTLSYLRIKKILSSENISDYVSEANREIIVISPTKGKLEIGYPLINDNLDLDLSIEPYEKILHKKLDSKEFPKFFKNELYDFLFSVEKEKRLKFLILNLNTVIESANRNYEIYLANFSFDKVKNEYDSRKQKYFDELRSIVSKITGYSIGLPISISAASFAAFRTLDSLPTYILILVSFLIFTIYFVFMLRNNREDLEILLNDFQFDFSVLFQKEFFTRNKAEKLSFEKLQKLLDNRINNLITKVHILFSIVLILNTSLFVILLLQIKIAITTIFIITVVILSIFLVLYFFKFKPNGK